MVGAFGTVGWHAQHGMNGGALIGQLQAMLSRGWESSVNRIGQINSWQKSSKQWSKAPVALRRKQSTKRCRTRFSAIVFVICGNNNRWKSLTDTTCLFYSAEHSCVLCTSEQFPQDEKQVSPEVAHLIGNKFNCCFRISMHHRVCDFAAYPADAIYGKKGSPLVGAWFRLLFRLYDAKHDKHQLALSPHLILGNLVNPESFS